MDDYRLGSRYVQYTLPCFNLASYFISVLLVLASQRIETVLNFSGEPKDQYGPKGASPTVLEWIIIAWVAGM